MGRVENFTKSLEDLNKGGGANAVKCTLLLLTDIALSLATIADALTERGKKE